jgi:hypothetical protein
LAKLEHYGIRGTFGALIKSYLTQRYQRVALKDKTNTVSYSDWELVKHAVPQGSIHCPLFFLLYINDLPTVTAKNAKLVLNADNTSLIITNPSPIEFANKLNRVFDNVKEWFRKNLLFLNYNRTTYLQFQTKKSQKLDLSITLQNNKITNSKNTKFLGLTIEDTLSWKCHINHILSRLSSACYEIKVITPIV